MMTKRLIKPFSTLSHGIPSSVVLLVLCFSLSLITGPARAQEVGQIQESTGRIEPGDITLYVLPNLRQSQHLTVRAQATSGNLDPLLGVIDGSVDPEVLETAFEDVLEQASADGLDPLEEIEALRDRFTLAWDDDSGGGLTAALELEIPADGDYRLLVAGAPSALGGETSGGFRMLVGLDAPHVLQGNAETTGDIIAVSDVEATPPRTGVQEIGGSLTADKSSTFVELNDFGVGDTLYVHIEGTSDDLRPVLVLSNFARKPIRSANLQGNDTAATLQYTFPADASNYRLEIEAFDSGGEITTGDYRLLLGANAPEVLMGEAEPDGREIAREPIEVKLGIKLEQIIEVDHQSEFFTAAANLRMEWNDRALAFNPEECQCAVKTFSGNSVNQFISDAESRWPDFTIHNQQGNRWTQNRNVVVFANGDVIYFERFTTNLQVDFDFQQYPFDTQEFVIRVDSLFPEEYFIFADLEGFSEISADHGENEFILEELNTDISSQTTTGGSPASRFTFSFEAPRHPSYYLFQVFVPILLIILVSWVTFFLKDYVRRIEVASANLLLFIAFSFSLADNYPRLGYLTFLDAVMAIMFVVNALVVVYNVWMRRMEMNQQEARVEQIDNVMDWLYPLIYVGLLTVLVIWFF